MGSDPSRGNSLTIVRGRMECSTAHPFENVQQGFALLALCCAVTVLSSGAALTSVPLESPDRCTAALLLTAQGRPKGQCLAALDSAPRSAMHKRLVIRRLGTMLIKGAPLLSSARCLFKS